MDYLRSAASAVLSKSAGPLPGFIIGAPFPSDQSSTPTIWSLHQGTKREDNSPCTIFVFENNSNGTHLTLARNALRKLRTLRHPDVLKLIDSNETTTGVYIAVEPVRRLTDVLSNWTASQESKKESCVWGLSKVANALKFIHTGAASIHGNIRPESVFVSQGGQWKLAGFELLTSKEDPQGVVFSLSGSLPDASLYASPEVKQNGWSILRDQDTHTLDSYSFALLAFSAFNAYYPSSIGQQSPPQGSIPSPLFALLRRCLSPTAKTRMSVGQLYDSASVQGGVFKTNKLAVIQEGCDGLMLASDGERSEVIGMLSKSSSSLPPDFLTHVVLPCLVNALNISCQSASNPQAQQTSTSRAIHPSTLLPLVLQLGSPLSDTEWNQSILPCILESFNSADRSIRVTLLDHLPSYISRVDARKVSDAIWPRLITGFSDSSAGIREATLKSILPIASKLTDRIKNNDLLRQLAKTQVDVEESIRTNTTILLGRLSPQLNATTRKSVLIPAFSRSLKDPFVHARVAGLMAFMATSEGEGASYSIEDLAKSVLPAVVVLLVDSEKLVRDQAIKAVDLFLGRVRDEMKNLPEGSSAQNGLDEGGIPGIGAGAAAAAVVPTTAAGSSNGTASTAGGAASALAGWAMSGAMSYLREPEDMTTANAPASASASTSLSPPMSSGSMDTNRPPLLTGPSSSSFQSTNTNSDLIDIEDDTADWSNFESAPVKKPIKSTRTATTNSKMNMSSNGMSRLSLKAATSTTDRTGAGGASDPWADSTPPNSNSGTSTPSTAAAFKAPVPSWGDVDDDDDGGDTGWGAESTKQKTDVNTATATTAPVSKEDKRAAMERQREERRERMRKLKESKGKKLGDSLM